MSDADLRTRGFELLKQAAFGSSSVGRALGYGGLGAATGVGTGMMTSGEAEDIAAQALVGGLAGIGFAGGSQGVHSAKFKKILKSVKHPGKLKRKSQKLKHKQNISLYEKGVDQYRKKGAMGAGLMASPALLAYGLYKAGPDALGLGKKMLSGDKGEGGEGS